LSEKNSSDIFKKMNKKGYIGYILKLFKRWRREMPYYSWPKILLFKFKYIKGYFKLIYILPIIQKAISKTPQFSTNPNADIEVHTVLCHKDVYIYLAAIKSFLRFYNNLKVLVHDDGTLSEKDKEFLKTHVKGIEIIDRVHADNYIRNFLKEKKHCLAARERKITYFQALDYFIFSKADKIIGLDSDTLFYKKPEEIIEWAESRKKILLYNYEKGGGENIFIFNNNGKVINERYPRSFPFKLLTGFNGGFFCSYREVFNADLAEKYLRYIHEELLCNKRVCSEQAQNLIGCLFVHSGIPEKPLLSEKYRVLVDHTGSNRFLKKCTFKHFNRPSIRFEWEYNYLRDILKIAEELRNSKPN
jgi:hypothetical protein